MPAISAAPSRIASRIALPLLCMAAGMAVLVSLTAAVLAMSYSGPLGDDFCLAAQAKEYSSWITFTREMYLRTNGRWAFFLGVGLLLPHIDLIRAYPLLIIPLTLVLFGSLYALWRTILDESKGVLNTALLSLATLAVLLDCVPGVSDYIYWFSAALAYELSIALGILVIAGLLELDRHVPSPRQRRIRLLLLSALTLVVSGLLEVSALSIIIVTASGALVSSRQSRPAWLIICGIAILGLMITLAAPGNKERAKLLREQASGVSSNVNLPPTRMQERISMVSRIVVKGLVVSFTEWLTDVKFLSASVLLILYRRLKGPALDGSDRGYRGLRWIALLVWILLIVAWYSAPVWFYCANPPGRAAGSAYTIFLVGWIVNIWLWVPGLSPGPDPRADWFAEFMLVGALLVFALSLVTTGNARAGLGDFLHGRLQSYRQALLSREQRCRQARLAGSKDVVLPGIPNVPKSFSDDPISKQPESWVNQGLADYYGIASVRLAPSFDPFIQGRAFLFRPADQ
ncbi:MAG: DUF6056 family protein [Isosphaeraceae bacterium]